MMRPRGIAAAFLALAFGTAHASGVLVEFGSPMRYLANSSDPGLGTSWTDESFPDASWPAGTYGVGYENSPPGATALLQTTVPSGTYSVYTRARFEVSDVGGIGGMLLGVDYDDGYVAWINGVEVARSPSMPAGSPTWNTNSGSHESSNGTSPNYGTPLDITAAALPALHDGENVLAIGVWNSGAPFSTDLVLVPRLSWDCDAPLVRGPYLQLGTPTSVHVRWRTAIAVVGRVIYGVSPGSLDLVADEAAPTTEHEVVLTGLSPATPYAYAVGSPGAICEGSDGSVRFTTPPITGTRDPLRIWVIGDSGTGNANARAVRDAYTSFGAGQHTDLWLLLGDNAYPSGTDAEYQSTFFDVYPEMLRTAVVWPTMGNHDGISSDSATQSGPYYDSFTLPRLAEAGGVASGTEAYYSFDWGNVHFVCLDSYESDRSPGGAMMTWLQQDLLATGQDWVVAFWHHPPYSKGSHDSDVEFQLVQMRENALPVFEGVGVDLTLAGHSHSYERTFLIDGHYGLSGTFGPAHLKDGGDGRIEGDGAYRKASTGTSPHEGAVSVVAGSSGQTSGGPLDHPAMYVSLNELGSLVLDVRGHQIDGTFLDAQGVVRDHFTIAKGPATPPIAAFSASPRSGPVPLTVPFTDLSTEAPTVWEWDFENDGLADSATRNPQHTFAVPGAYDVRLTASNGFGADEALETGYVCAYAAGGAGDRDGDGVADAADCAPCDAGASALPGDVGATVTLGPTHDEIHWSGPPLATSWNVYRGTRPPGAAWANVHTCFEPHSPDASSIDPSAPSLGALHYYLVAAVNACGQGTLGTGTGGSSRAPQSSCP